MDNELNKKLLSQLTEFMISFEIVFDIDWDHSYDSLLDNQDGNNIISPTGTFINPGVDISCCNWGNREGLLNTYKELLSIMMRAGIYKSPLDM